MRRRFVQINGELVEVPRDYVSEPRSARDTGVLWNDRAYQDMGDPRFKSRSQHRDYMKANGLTTVDDFTQTWKGAEKARIRSRNAQDLGVRKSDIQEAIRQVSAGYKPRLRREE